ncbi:hypothetical protein LL912_06780 [Niabella sp. CC-SYL272]|uniref:hypothetical protein n=1 Tax=Niabella agricola TaxID=2891571 RepID=UPI001F1FA1FF|nr:hypothetical protein [Niabella agricola]MCF3108476.1 hypothetical protein [Niabella agricola]
MNIIIPEPCQENWEHMQPEEKGRFCSACCKTVIDFTGMSPAAIRAYLEAHRSQRVCGRLTASQLTIQKTTLLSLTKSVWQSALGYTRKLAAVFLLFFAFSQDPQAQTATKTSGKDSVTAAPERVVGKIAVCPPKPEPVKKKTPYKAERLPVLKSDRSITRKEIITTGIIVISHQKK